MARTEGTTTAGSTGPVDTSQGWGVAGLIVALAVTCAASAWWYHNRSYRDPVDSTWVQEADRRGGAGAAEHGAKPPGGH